MLAVAQYSSRYARPRLSTDAICSTVVARLGQLESAHSGLDALATSRDLGVPPADPAAAIDAGTGEDSNEESGRENGNDGRDLDLDFGWQ